MDNKVRYILDEEQTPKQWYNIEADLPRSTPKPINPATGKPLQKEELCRIFAKGLMDQEYSKERWIDIPHEVRDVLRQWRPSPMHRARRLEKALNTPARIYYKYEGVSPSGSHKTNSAFAQVFQNHV